MRRKIKATEFTCDGCGKVIISTEDSSDLPDGYHGFSVIEVDSAGGRGCKDWYACKPTCIGAAVCAAIKLENNPDAL